jgi:ureidoacrylate peracid hydrolase
MNINIKPALTIIDMQNGFMADGGSFHQLGLATSKYKRIIPAIRDVYYKAKLLEIPVFFSQAIREKSGIDMLDKYHKILPERRRERIQKVPLCVRGTWDGDFIAELKPAEDDLIVQKRRDSIFQDTEYELWLRSLHIDTIIFAGIDTSICVESSLRDAFNRGWDVILIADATASLNQEYYKTTISEVTENFGLVMSSAKLFASLKAIAKKKFLLRQS